ncbi:hypothetical protein CBR_g39109 [Chara braunii]|uniref:CCHC-type domain-containing protein n=1 Tax=Chara braunii TaxID=69332 RepID=A0A388LR85_CHABU|nr:hypothetical protein CBR_g39109 [Chara braunii]|eukprot:GBG84733.1 hypothetical protein CBR_g39109 [Chara braunii]
MSERRDYARREHRSSSEERGGYRSHERPYRRSPPRCFGCDERGHYANQCPNRARPSTSHDTRRGRSTSPKAVSKAKNDEAEALQRQIEEPNRSLASVSELVRCEKAKKAEEERLRKEAEEEQHRIREEKEAREKKEKKRLAKLKKDAEREAEMDKRFEIRIAIRTGDFFDWMEANLGRALEFAKKVKGKKKVVVLSKEDSEHASSSSETEKLRQKTGRLTISEKRKRGPEPVFDDSPPMITPKRTPWTQTTKGGATTGRITSSKHKMKTKLSPYVENNKTNLSNILAKLHFRNQVMEEIRCLDAQELQSICKNEGVTYNGKMEAIFDIASHRTRVAFGEIPGCEQSESVELEDEDITTVDEGEPEDDEA